MCLVRGGDSKYGEGVNLMSMMASLHQKRFWVYSQYMIAKLDGDELGMCLWKKNLEDIDKMIEKLQVERCYGRNPLKKHKTDIADSYRRYRPY